MYVLPIFTLWLFFLFRPFSVLGMDIWWCLVFHMAIRRCVDVHCIDIELVRDIIGSICGCYAASHLSQHNVNETSQNTGGRCLGAIFCNLSTTIGWPHYQKQGDWLNSQLIFVLILLVVIMCLMFMVCTFCGADCFVARQICLRLGHRWKHKLRLQRENTKKKHRHGQVVYKG